MMLAVAIATPLSPCRPSIAQQQRPWNMNLVQFQDLTNQLDVLRRLTGIQIQEQYNVLSAQWLDTGRQADSARFAGYDSPVPRAAGETVEWSISESIQRTCWFP